MTALSPRIAGLVTGWWHARAGEIAEHRFLDSPQVTAAEIIETLGQRTAERCCGRPIIAVFWVSRARGAGRAGGSGTQDRCLADAIVRRRALGRFWATAHRTDLSGLQE